MMRSYNQKLSSRLPWAQQVFARLVLAVLFFNLSILIHLFSQANRSLVTYDPLTDVQIAEIKSQIHKYLQGAIDEIEVNSFLSREGLGYCFHPVLSQGRINENVFWRAVFNPKVLRVFYFLACYACLLVFIPFLLFLEACDGFTWVKPCRVNPLQSLRRLFLCHETLWVGLCITSINK